jgi:hypothetical protein
MNRLLTFTAVLALPIAGCSDRTNEPAASGTPDSELVSPAASSAAPATAPTADPSAAVSEGMAQDIPATMRGRFGLVPADCTSTRGDAKGLVTIADKTMRFYESVATLKSSKPVSATQLRGSFAYTGEGMEWSRDVGLESRDGGKTLIMEEFGEDAPPGPRSYTRCD